VTEYRRAETAYEPARTIDEPIDGPVDQLDEPDLDESPSTQLDEPDLDEPDQDSGGLGDRLLADEQVESLLVRWREVQVGFVDAPRQTLVQADALVADVMRHLSAMFSAEREQLEAQWSQGSEVSTEQLRITLQRYRSFFDRLLET
jgi:hypothetical protein